MKKRENTIYSREIIYSDNKYYYTYKNSNFFFNLKKNIMKLQDAPFMPDIKFMSNGYVVPELKGHLLTLTNISLDDKKNIKNQIIDLVKFLNSKSLAHRDLHIGNCFYENKKLFLIDYEFLIEDECKLTDSYDLNENSKLESPLKSNHMNIFHKSDKSFKNFLLPIKININDFIKE